MSARRTRAADWKTVAEIRRLQSRAAEMEAARAGAERGTADERHVAAEAALARAQQGWTEAVQGSAFDPGLVSHWMADVGRRQADEETRGEELRGAERRLEEKQVAWNGAQARVDAADARRADASAQAARRRDEAQLATGEDRAALQGRRP